MKLKTSKLSLSRSRFAGAFGAGKLSPSRSRFAGAFGAGKLSLSRSRIAGAFGAVAVSLAIVLTAFLALRVMAPPGALPADAPATEFSAERAFGLLKDIAVEPHPLGTPAHDVVRDRILRMWRDLGFEPEIQAGLVFGAAEHYAARVENILARLPGAKPTPGGALMLASHYDSVEPAPGAADAGSGVVTLLETARALTAGPPLAEDVIFLITDAEEDGLLGARLFQDEHPWAKGVGLVLNFEARGTAGPSLMFQTSAGNQRLISALAAAPHPRAYSFGATIYRSMPNDTDLTIWLKAGIQGLNFAFIGRGDNYHTAGDNLAALDLRSLQHNGSYALALARRFGNDGVPPRTRGDAIHFSIFGDVLVRYSKTAALLLVGVIAALLLVAGRLWIARRRLRPAGVMRGVLFMLAAMLVSGGSGYGFLAAVGAAHRSFLPAAPWTYSVGYFLALVFLAAAATTFLYGVLRARKSAFEMAFGAAVLWLCLTVAVTLLAADASYLASWPALFLAIAVFFWARRGHPEEESGSAPHFWGAALTALGVLLVAVPLLVLFFESMFLTPLMAAIQAVLVSVMLTAATPALEIMKRGLGRALPILCAGLFVGFAVAAALTVRYSARIPRLASLQLLQDFDGGRAFWVTPTPSPDAWTESVAGGRFQVGHPQPEYAGRPDRYAFREAPASSSPPPEIRLVEDRETGASRSLRLRVVSPRGGRRIVIACQAEKLSEAAVEGRPLILIPENATGFALVFMNPGPAGFELALEVGAGTPVRMTVRESNPGLTGLPGFALPPAPPGIRPHRIGVLLSKSFLFPPPVPAETAPR